MEPIDQDAIRIESLPYLTTAKRGYTSKGDLCEVIFNGGNHGIPFALH